MFVANYMKHDAYTVREDALLVVAIQLMHEHNIHHLSVVDNGRRLVGIISDRDVRSAVGFDRTLEDKLTVSEIMTSDPVVIQADDTIEEAMEVLSTKKFGSLPVMRAGALAGIITTHDVLRAFHEVLGLTEKGHRIEVALPEGRVDLACVFQALHDGDHEVISAVVSRTRRDGGEPSLYLRVPVDQVRRIEQCLRKATAILLAPEQPK